MKWEGLFKKKSGVVNTLGQPKEQIYMFPESDVVLDNILETFDYLCKVGKEFDFLMVSTMVSEKGNMIFNAKIGCNACAAYMNKMYNTILNSMLLKDYDLKDGDSGFSYLNAAFETHINAKSKDYAEKVLISLGEKHKLQHPNKNMDVCIDGVLFLSNY